MQPIEGFMLKRAYAIVPTLLIAWINNVGDRRARSAATAGEHVAIGADAPWARELRELEPAAADLRATTLLATTVFRHENTLPTSKIAVEFFANDRRPRREISLVPVHRSLERRLWSR